MSNILKRKSSKMFLFIALVSLFSVSAASSIPKSVCATISNSLVSGSSPVFHPGDEGYAIDINHFALSAQQNSTCTVEPSSSTDMAIVMKLLAKSRTPFAIKSGGHNLNPDFSSTPGVLISMNRLKQLKYHSKSQTVEVGPGLVWDEVYAGLEPYNVSVVGARATGVGVGGLLLGGGYSYKTNQYGLAVDSILAMELVLPSGQVKVITHASDKDLFFALRGGGNNFGVVTKFTLKTYPQTAVWGGSITYSGEQSAAVSAAVLKYTTENKDPRTALQCTFATLGGQALILVNLFYDAPTAPAGLFNAFLAIPAVVTDISTRSYLSLILSANTDLTAGMRGIYHTISHTAVTPVLLTAMQNETNFHSSRLQMDSLVLNGYVVEPFLPAAYRRGSETAYPPDRSENIHPMNIYYAWTDATSDSKMIGTARASAAHLREVALGERILASALYPNYAAFATSPKDLYGKNLGRLQRIRKRIDPSNVMSLTGGFGLE